MECLGGAQESLGIIFYLGYVQKSRQEIVLIDLPQVFRTRRSNLCGTAKFHFPRILCRGRAFFLTVLIQVFWSKGSTSAGWGNGNLGAVSGRLTRTLSMSGTNSLHKGGWERAGQTQNPG